MAKTSEKDLFSIGLETISSFIVFFIGIVAVAILYPVWDVIFIAAVLSFVLRPLQKKLKKPVGKFLAALIPTILVIILVFIPFMAFVQFLNINAPYVSDLLSQNAVGNVFSVLEPYVPEATIQASLSTFLQTWLTNFVLRVSSVAIDLFILVTLIFYFLKEGNRITNYFFSVLPSKPRKVAEIFLDLAEDNLKAVILGHFLTSLIISFFAILGMYLLNAPYFRLLAVFVLFIGIVPVFGTWIILIPLALFHLGIGDTPTAIAYLLLALFNSTVDDIIFRPKLVGMFSNIHPVLILLGFFAGLSIFGLAGVILGPLLMVLLKTVLDAYREVHIRGTV